MSKMKDFEELRGCLEEMDRYYFQRLRELEEEMPDDEDYEMDDTAWKHGNYSGASGVIGALYLVIFGGVEYNEYLNRRLKETVDED